MPFWSLNKNKGTPKKEGRPTEAELLKRDNCKTLTLKDGTKFILVGGTHGASFDEDNRQPNDLVHYELVKVFFDILEYDSICLESIITLHESYEVRQRFSSIFFNRIKSDKHLYAELTRLMGTISEQYPDVANFFQQNPPLEWTKKDLSKFQSSLKKIASQFKLSEYGRKKLALFANEVMVTYTKWVQNQSTLLTQKDAYDALTNPEKFMVERPFLELPHLFLTKAVKQGKDLFLCDSFLPGGITDNPKVTLYLGLILGAFLPQPFNVGTIYCSLYILYNYTCPSIYSERYLESQYMRYVSKLNYLFIPLLEYTLRYREALTAFQLLSLAEEFKARNEKTGTFLYWSHIDHTNGVLTNLKLGRETLKKKLNSWNFFCFKSLYRDYIPLEVSKLSLKQREHFLSVAAKYGTPVDKL